MPGDVYVGGEGLASGYLTGSQIHPLPIIRSSAPGLLAADLVKTDQRARFVDGVGMELIGRMGQLQLTPGFRVELAEIRSFILGHPGVWDVWLVPHASNARYGLTAYVVCKADPPQTSEALKLYLADYFPAYMVPTEVVMLSALPLDSFGRIDEGALPQPTVPARGGESTQARALTSLEKRLCEIWAKVFRRESVGPEENFFDLGGDSIITLQISSRANQVGIRVTPKQIWQCKTVAGLAAVAGISQNGDVDQKTVSGVVPLLPIQRWFFGNQFENPHHWNQSVVLEPCIPMDEDSLEAAFRALVVHHDALRLRFLQEEGGWEQINDPRDSHRYVRRIDLSGLSEPARAEALAASMAEVQGSLDLERGPLLSAAYYQLGKPLPARLLFVVHHLAVDGVSWRVLLEDLQTLLQQSSKQEPLRLPPKTTSYQEWAKKLVDYAQTEAVVAEADFWRSMTPGRPFRLPLDFPDAPNTEAFTQKVVTQFSAEETRVLLQDMPGKLHVQINEVLVYALGRALSEWVGRDQVLFDLEGHGREDIFSAVDLSRTVGWFTTLYPIALKFGARVSCQDELHQVRDTLRGVPAKGLGFGLLQYLRDHGSINHSLDALCGNQVVFNYLGQVDLGRESKALLQRVWENAGPSRSPAGHRAHVLDVNARVAEEKLQIGWTYASRQLRRETVERLASRFATILRELSRQTTFTEGRASTTLSVFPLAPVGPAKLAGLLGRFPDVTDIYPLSPMQQLFHSLLSTNSSVGCEQFQFLLQGDLDPARLKRAWEELAARHPVLRTGFFAEDLEEPIQFVRSRVELPWIDLDWTDVDASERSSRLKLLLEEDRTQGYSLSVPPLLRFHLIRLGQRQWQLIWSFHHLLLDGWSWPLLYSELVAIYDALATASTAQLPAVVEYRSYIQWLQKQDRATAKLYWRNELRGFETPTPLGFAADPSTTAVGTARPELARELSTPETGALVGLARRHEVSLSTLVEAAWALALAHQSALKDVVFGVTVSGRPSSLAGVESIVGMFINNLPRRINILEEEEIGTLLRRIHSKQMETADFEHTSLFQIREWSQVPGRFRLFNSLVLFQNYRKVHSSSADAPHVLRDAKVQAEIVTSYPITLVCSPGDALKLKALYDPAQIRSQGAEYYLDLAVKALRSLSEGKVHRVAELLAGLPPRRADGVDLGADSTRRGSQEPVAPRTPTETKLAQIWERVLGLPSVGVKDNFFDIGGHSLPAVSVFREIQRVWKVNLPLVTLFKAPTIEALAAVIEGRDGGANWKSLVPIKSSGTRPPFYCIHGVGGNILEFADMARYLPDDQPLYGLQAQGLDGRTPRHTSVEQMATHYVKEIREFQPLGPYYLGGSSFGGLVAMEVAQQLSAMGERIGILVLFDTWAPGHPKYPATLPSWRRKLYRWRLRFELHYSNLRLSEGSARREYLTRKAVRLLARWRRQGHQWWTRFLGRLHPRAIRDVRKAGHRALAKYTPRPYVGKITLLRATQQPQGIIDDRTNGWSLMAQSGVDVFDVPGHHGSMMEDPRARVLVEVLTTCLTTAQAEHMPASRACEPITADG